MSIETDGVDAQAASSSAASARPGTATHAAQKARLRIRVVRPHPLPPPPEETPAPPAETTSRLFFARALAGRGWRATRRWFAANTFTPAWAPERLRAPIVGYAVAALAQVVCAGFVLLLIHHFGSFAFQGTPELLAIALIALTWGAGPSVVSAICGAALIYGTIFPPHFGRPPLDARNVVELSVFLAAGLVISIVASQTQRARLASNAFATRLVAEQTRLETILEAVPDMISIHDANGAIVRRNRTAKLVAPDVSGDERIDEAHDVYGIHDLDGRPLTEDELPIARALRGQTITNLEVLSRLTSGEHIFSVSAAPFRDQWGAILGAVAVTRDITPLRRSEQAAAERAAQLEATFDALVDGVVVFDIDAHLLSVNNATRRLIGMGDASDLYGRPVDERMALLHLRDERGVPVPPERLPQRRVLRGEILLGLEADDYLLHTLDGREVRVNIGGAPVRDTHGVVIGGVLALRDVTVQRRLEERTHDALVALLTVATTLVEPSDTATDKGARIVAQRLIDLTRSVLDCTRVAILTLDRATDVMRALAVTGLSAEHERQWWVEQRALERQGLRFSDGLDREVTARLRAGEALTIDLTQPPYDQPPNVYGIRSVLIAPMCLGEDFVGMITYDYSGADHDYTRGELLLASGVARLAALVLERERLLRESAEDRARMLALEQANARMDEFLGIASHELKTPLTTIKANVQLTERRLNTLDPTSAHFDDQVRRLSAASELMQRTQRQVDRLDRLVNDLLDVSRIRAGKLELRRDAADLAEIVREAVREQRMAWPGRPIELTVPDGPVPVEADADRIGQVVTNYLTNALKYSAEEESVAVTLDLDTPGVARMAVRDRGPGLPPEEQERVWERFHRASGVEVRSGSGVGLGLGLHISREIVERHGGAIGLESVVGMGSTFSFTLPLAAV